MADLKSGILKAEEEIKFQKAWVTELYTEVEDRCAEEMAREMARRGKITGSLKQNVEGIPVSYEVVARDTWDQDALRKLMEAMHPDQHVIEMKLSVSKKTFDSLSDVDLIDRLIDARTTKYTSSVSFV